MLLQIPSTRKDVKTQQRTLKKHLPVGDRQVETGSIGRVAEGGVGGEGSASTDFEHRVGVSWECGSGEVGDSGEFEAWCEDVEVYSAWKYQQESVLFGGLIGWLISWAVIIMYFLYFNK